MVWSLPVRQKRVLLDALIEGDGNIRKDDTGRKRRPGWRYATSSLTLASHVQRLAIECGHYAHIGTYPPAEAHHKTRYSVEIGNQAKRRRMLLPARNRAEVPYDGEVFCLTVPTGAYITRRNGKMSICGNSAHWFNRADFGLTLARRPNHTELHVWKCRFSHQGKLGVANLVFDPATR